MVIIYLLQFGENLRPSFPLLAMEPNDVPVTTLASFHQCSETYHGQLLFVQHVIIQQS